MRVLGVDPGLTRCGVGIVDVAGNRAATLVHVEVLRTAADLALEQRLLLLGDGIERLLDEHEPDAVALERVFAQQNLRSVMGVAQVSGVVLRSAAQRGHAVAFHTPTEVKAALTGYGQADKRQLGTMVAKVLRLDAAPTPADASDALALAICHAWRGSPAVAAESGPLTPAQEAWRAAEASAASSAAARRVKG